MGMATEQLKKEHHADRPALLRNPGHLQRGEENLFFLPMVAPVGVMLGEHDRMRGLMHGLAEVVDRYRAGEERARDEIVWYASDYSATLRSHIEKENNVLFKMAEMHLLPDEEKELAERFESMEVEKIGAGKHEELHAVLDRLEGIYLPDRSA